MKLEYKNHIKNIIGKLITQENTEYNDKVCFLKNYSGFSIEEEDIINIMSTINLECDMLYYRFDASKIQGVFCPFLSFIRELYGKYYSDVNYQEFVKAANVYPVVESLFTSYLKSGYCERIEDIIPREVEYEQQRIIQSIVNIIKYISNEHKMIIVLDRLHSAQESTINVLLELMQSKSVQNLAIIGSYNEAQDVRSYMRESWNSLLNYIKDMGIAIDYDDKSREIVEENVFIPNESGMKKYLRNINDMYVALALEQAKYYLDIIYRAIESDNLSVDVNSKIDVLNLYALVTLYNGEEKVAYVYNKKVYDIDAVFADKERLIQYYVVMVLINHKSGQRNLAYRNLNEARNILKTINSRKLKVKLDMLELVVILDKYPNVLLWNPEVNMPNFLVEEAIKSNQKLHLAYAYIFGFNMLYDVEYPKDNGKIGCENMEEFCKGIELAEELDNIQIQIRAWQKSAVQAAEVGKFDEIVYYYNKCLEIMKGHDRKHEEAQIYNGIGYNCLINEKYSMAYDYFYKAVEIGINVDTPKYILDAVYNLAVTGVIVGDYEATIKYVNITLKMMSNLKIERLNVCNKTKLYGLAIFSYIKIKQVYNAKLFFNIMETSLNHILSSDNPNYNMWEDDIYLYYVVKSMLDVEEENIDAAREDFAMTEKVWERISSKQKYILPKVIIEEAKFYENIKEYGRREEIIRKAANFCKNTMLVANGKMLEGLIEGKEPQNDFKLQTLSDEIVNEIFKMTNRCELRMEVDKKNKMLSFFENWVDSLNDEFESIDKLISNEMLVLKNTFDIDSTLYISTSNNTPVIKYCDNEINLKQYQVKYVYDYFMENGRRMIISRFEKSYQYHEELISVFNRDDISSMLVIPFVNSDMVTEIFFAFRFKKANYTENLKMFYEDESDIFRTAFRELIEAINRETIKKQLEKISITDVLTGLNNRQGMRKCLDNEMALYHNNGNAKHLFTILYMDLDNFKYCNDQFGHEAGDVVLVAFSRMLEGIVEDSGYIIRYGGDEFIIILPNKDVDFGVEIAEKIFANLRHNKGFKRNIENQRREEINIKEENRVTCSIGIASGNASSYSGISRILKKSDEALYEVKRGTKHSYKIWEAQ